MTFFPSPAASYMVWVEETQAPPPFHSSSPGTKWILQFWNREAFDDYPVQTSSLTEKEKIKKKHLLNCFNEEPFL